MLKKITKLIWHILIVLCLTVLTQIGGLVYLVFIVSWKVGKKRIPFIETLKIWKGRLLKAFSFILFYVFISLFIIPILAKPFGRVPLPITNNAHIKPLNILTCLFNRHYVKPDLYAAFVDVSTDLNAKYPNTTIAYLDANFPFFDGFSLLPHLSHNDGEKLDVAFFYTDAKTGVALNDAAPSIIGYGVFEEPKTNEINQPNNCAKKGYWQYSILSKIVPQWNKQNYVFDANRTKTMVELFAKHPSINKLFIEPHLKTRLNLHSSKIRYHGCGAVRHDDHLHIQL